MVLLFVFLYIDISKKEKSCKNICFSLKKACIFAKKLKLKRIKKESQFLREAKDLASSL